MTVEGANSSQNKGEWRSERWPVTASIAIFLRPIGNTNGLVLVRSEGRWGLPSGGLGANEIFLNAARREILEETGINPDRYYFGTLGIEKLRDLQPRYAVCLPGSDRTQVGIIFETTYVGPRLNWDGWEVKGDVKTKYAKPFKMKDIMRLVERELVEGGGVLYKPHFNFPLLVLWIFEETRTREGWGWEHTKAFEQWASRLNDQIPNLVLSEDGARWSYWPSYIGEQDPRALKRKYGRFWGD